MASAEEIAKELTSVIGKNDEESTVKSFLNTGFPPLNEASSSDWKSGFPVGRMIEIAGPASAGKTAIATRAMAAAQKAGGVAGFCDHERSFSFVLAPKLGLDVSPGKFVFRKPRTFEESLQICVLAATTLREKKLIHKDAPICWVFDSLAFMVPQSALFDKNGNVRSSEDRNMNDNTALARATSAHFPAFAQHCEELGICAIFLNQMRSKIGVMFGDPRKTTGGSTPEFAFSQRLWLSASQIKDSTGKTVIGQEVTGKFMKNKVSRPFKEAKWRFMFAEDGTGRFDQERSLVEFLMEQGIIPKAPGKGMIEWEGKPCKPETLARKIEKENAYDKLIALLPAKIAEKELSEEMPSEDKEVIES